MGPVESSVSCDDPPAVRAECQAEDGIVAIAGIDQAELFLTGGRIQDDQVQGVARADPAAVGTESHVPEAAGDVPTGEDLLASSYVTDDQVPFLGRLVENERPRHGGDPRAVRAERHAVERLSGLAKGAKLEVTLAPRVIPLPAPEVLGAAVEQLQGSGDVVVQTLAVRQVDPADVVLAPEFLRLSLGDLGLPASPALVPERLLLVLPRDHRVLLCSGPEHGHAGEPAHEHAPQRGQQAGDRLVPARPATEAFHLR
jgi:hypothetical protein